MPSTLTTAVARIRTNAPGPESPLPILRACVLEADVVDDGRPASLLPYHAYDGYPRELRGQDHVTVVLENEHLRATFLPGLGGRLWSLVDLARGRELLHTMDTVQAGNLALRNAWFAGGVEWNLGTTGHWPLTCSPVHAGRVTAPDGTPVLRMWEYERMRALVWRIDAWLPPGSTVLYVRPRLHNPHEQAVPIYWWSNIAVPQADGVRVLAPTTRALHFDYRTGLHDVSFPDDPDLSYPAALEGAADHFFDLRPAEQPWIAALDSDGYGLLHSSTPRLLSRKLFRWGCGAGGERWQQWLSGDGRYLEIQAGVAPTQLDHTPIPPGETWAWTETYGPVTTDPAIVHGPWQSAYEGVPLPDRSTLAMADAAAEAWADTAPAESLASGSGWGAIAVHTGELPDYPGTPFGATGPEQQPWLQLWNTGVLPPSEPPAVTQTGPVWLERLAKHPRDWHALLHLGLQHFAAGDRAAARAAWYDSSAVQLTAWSQRNLAELDRLDGDATAAAGRLLHAQHLAPDCAPLTIETLDALTEAGRAADALRVVDRLGAEQRLLGRVRLYEARAALAVGDAQRAGAILEAGLVVPDLQEGDDALSDLWTSYQAAIGGTQPVPAAYDFRMQA